MSGGLRPQILKFSFQNPISCNIKRHRTLCSNSIGGSDLGGYVRGFMSSNHDKKRIIKTVSEQPLSHHLQANCSRHTNENTTEKEHDESTTVHRSVKARF